ncbi:hypothetical protein [Bradyrhizobium sp. AUGA SZCCT0431]|uniref:hypothetical protein n=1 Tax=Bradyrhizobium sp. AUGA SZCCT0431 TaxID=2807674 RepID=UPI001BA8EB09|nr:hypothetical protein [Bradyrhizobium sp. AUGA SZCCT0431]MBR1146696.1 hypothetical protein [Bradyrhizobium sp. AUGA SZCCT0431]
MNYLQIGLTPKVFPRTRGFLFINDDVIDGDVFDPTIHSFNPLKKLGYRGAREFAETVYGTEGKDTLTVRNGKRALTKALLTTTRLDQLDTEDEEAQATIGDLLISPILRKVLCGEPNFSFQSRPIVARLNRSEIGDFDAFILGSLLIRQFKGQIVIPDFGFYARPFHSVLIRENRLMAGVNTLAELDPKMRQLCLLMDKAGKSCTHEDAVTLAQYEGLIPSTNEYNSFIQKAIT